MMSNSFNRMSHRAIRFDMASLERRHFNGLDLVTRLSELSNSLWERFFFYEYKREAIALYGRVV